jgi:hypothetical protein
MIEGDGSTRTISAARVMFALGQSAGLRHFKNRKLPLPRFNSDTTET